MDIPETFLHRFGLRRERPVALLVESPLSMEAARRAIIAATRDGWPPIDYGQFWLQGTVEADEFDLRWGDEGDLRATVRGKLRADGDRVRVHALVSQPTAIVTWLGVLAFPFVILGLTSNHWLPADLGQSGAGVRWVVALALYCAMAFLIFRRPARPSFLIVIQAKEFLSRALLAEAIEVETRARD